MEIKVSDDGIGMEKEMVEKIQTATYSSRETKSTGIGLRNVMDRLRLYFNQRFHFAISSELGKGTTVTIKLPLIEGEDLLVKSGDS
ncbi:sensor histidine kinase [Sediminibacillus terrae]|uniref:sensor histidine kinase n=1 Tax=Sediminibacillus terrae TaxID=1562106 RepID=UPI0013874038|nr:ATP-binding protein [Sediminibacillus terrae]